MNTYHLWEGIGIELEYMLVDAVTLDVAPCAHTLFQNLGIDAEGDLDRGDLSWSNELANHVIELKTTHPAVSLEGLAGRLQAEVEWMSAILQPQGLALLPTAMHPWMNPRRETVLWPLGHGEIYALYHRLFDCHTHGWANLQSMHLNLAFHGDDEFARLHAAVRLLLPLLPALCASSPIVDGKRTGLLDTRLRVYQNNQKRFPAIAGDIIPEPVYSQGAYEKQIYGAIETAIAPHDPDRLLELAFLNSRGAIARFDRGSIEIRLMDVQECPRADLAIAEFVVVCLKTLADCDAPSLSRLQGAPTAALVGLLNDCTRVGLAARVTDPELRAHYGMREGQADTVASLLQRWLTAGRARMSSEAFPIIGSLLQSGNLATRILNALPPTDTPSALRAVYGKLARCLRDNAIFSS